MIRHMFRIHAANLYFAVKRNMCATGIALCASALLAPAGSAAQNLFAPVAQVNDSVVTNYELDQRMKLLSVLGGGVSRDVALEALIEDRLKSDAAARANITASDEAIAAAIQEFAARGSLAPEQLISLLGRQNVSSQTLRDFLSVSIAWRDYARARFVRRVSVSEADVTRALQETGPTGGLLVAMSEIFLPARTPEERAASERLAAQIRANPSIAAFAAAARKYSVAPSRDQSGRMTPAPIGSLPGPLRSAARSLPPGGISEPLSTQNAIGIFQLRSLNEIDRPTPVPTAIKYAAYYIAGGRSPEGLAAAQKLRTQVDSCDDLYGVAKDQPAEVLEIDTLPLAQIPADVAVQLAQLDEGEISTNLTRANGETLVFLMMCERQFEDTQNANREDVLNQLRTAQIASMAENHLSELRANATIVLK